ncbi:MAG: hypothetical protein J7M39_05210 [Anaerolineae bacterium]|nr:hypothetical protein [Anaerolineae bacterium]
MRLDKAPKSIVFAYASPVPRIYLQKAKEAGAHFVAALPESMLQKALIWATAQAASRLNISYTQVDMTVGPTDSVGPTSLNQPPATL